MTATPTTHTATPRRHQARLLVPAAIAALAFTATTAAAGTSLKQPRPSGRPRPTTVGEPSTSRRRCSTRGCGSGTAISPRPRASSRPASGSTPPSSTAVTAAPSGASTAWWPGSARPARHSATCASPSRSPLVDGRYASVRWTATGTYAGGFPGAKAQPGTVVTFTGTDTLRMRDGKFAEYWVNTDTLSLLTQLQAL
ncbi:ester cyclase [Streptomyces sp. S1D4-11]